jgi:ligand-binding sensor domain-containing protein
MVSPRQTIISTALHKALKPLYRACPHEWDWAGVFSPRRPFSIGAAMRGQNPPTPEAEIGVESPPKLRVEIFRAVDIRDRDDNHFELYIDCRDARSACRDAINDFAGGLARFEQGRWKRVEDDWNYPGKAAWVIHLDRQGTLWVATESTIVFLPARARRFQTTGVQVGQVAQFANSSVGKLWMAETTRSVRPVPDHGPSCTDPEIRVGSTAILFDHEGSLWITTLGDGLRRVPFPERLKSQKIGEFSHVVESFTASIHELSCQ